MRIKTRSMIIALFSLAVLNGCGSKQAPAESIQDIQRREGIPVRVQPVAKGTISAYEQCGGVAEGYQQSVVTAMIPGRVSAVRVNVGDRVKMGTSLMQIDPDDRTQSYSIIKQKLDEAQKQRERLIAISEKGGVAPEVLEKLDLQISEGEAGLEVIRKAQFVISPFSGVVVSVSQNVNNAVGPGTTLLELANLSKVRVPSTVSDVLVNRFRSGQQAIAVVGGDTLVGKVEKVPLAGAAATMSFTIETVFDNPEMIIKPGMYVPVKVVVDKRETALIIPQETLNTENREQYVYVIRDGVAHRSMVKSGIANGTDVEIIKGVLEGDKVVVSGAGLLRDGVKVKIVD